VAAPIWADFMTRATAARTVSDVKDFTMPDGVQSVLIDPDTCSLQPPTVQRLGKKLCGRFRAAVYCEVHGGPQPFHFHGLHPVRVFGACEPKTPQTDANGQPIPQPMIETGHQCDRPGTGRSFGAIRRKEKESLQKIFGIFGGKKKDPDKAKPKPEKGDSP